MIALLLRLWLALQPSDAEVAAFVGTDPADLSPPRAAEHLRAARVAGATYHVDPYLLLSIAWHESRYADHVITREPGARWSCGAMTPVPHRERCSAWELSTLGGYAEGARHVRMWLNLCHGSNWCALIAYGGGLGLVRVCARGKWIVRPGVDACDLAYVFGSRANVIRKRVEGARP